MKEHHQWRGRGAIASASALRAWRPRSVRDMRPSTVSVDVPDLGLCGAQGE